jgi:hypothetical protein
MTHPTGPNPMTSTEQLAMDLRFREDLRFLIAYTIPHPIREFVISNLVYRGWLTDEHSKKCELTAEGRALVDDALARHLAGGAQVTIYGLGSGVHACDTPLTQPAAPINAPETYSKSIDAQPAVQEVGAALVHAEKWLNSLTDHAPSDDVLNVLYEALAAYDPAKVGAITARTAAGDAEQVADGMEAWAEKRMSGPHDSRLLRRMVSEWAKRLRAGQPAPDEFLHEVIVDELTSALEKTDLIASEIWQIADEIVRRATGAEPSEDAYVIDQMGRLLAEISVIVNGPEPANGRWGYHDLPAKVASLAAAPDDVRVPDALPAYVVPSLIECARCMGIAQAKGDTASAGYWESQANVLVLQIESLAAAPQPGDSGRGG